MEKLRTKKNGILLMLVTIAAIAALMVGGLTGVNAAVGELAASNPITMTGTAAASGPTLMTLSWGTVGGNVSGAGTDAVVVEWTVDEPYIVEIKAANDTASVFSGVYGKLTGIDFANFKVEYNDSGIWRCLETDATMGWVNELGDYYFGPAGGDIYEANATKLFTFRVTPLAVVDVINISAVLVNDVIDPRPTS